MAPVETQFDRRSEESTSKPIHPDGLILEAWAQGFMVGALIVMSCITVANMRKGVILHKLILTELVLGTLHGTFIFPHPPVYGWYLSCTAVALNTSWSLHNVIAWIKNKPFLSRRVSQFYITTVALAQVYWILEIYANFAYFNNYNKIFLRTRPLEALFRDPWWIWTCSSLLYNIHTQYSLSLCTIIRASPRFGLLLGSMLLSVLFLLMDIASVLGAFDSTALPDGLNPWWKLSFCFKCLTDTLVLDDFKTALDRLWRTRTRRLSRSTILSTGTNASASYARGDDEDPVGRTDPVERTTRLPSHPGERIAWSGRWAGDGAQENGDLAKQEQQQQPNQPPPARRHGDVRRKSSSSGAMTAGSPRGGSSGGDGVAGVWIDVDDDNDDDDDDDDDDRAEESRRQGSSDATAAASGKSVSRESSAAESRAWDLEARRARTRTSSRSCGSDGALL